MDTYWQKLRFLRSQGLKSGLSKAARVAASLGLVFTLLGPNMTATSVSADDMEWTGNSRPMLTDEADTDGDLGYTRLPEFGDVFHAIAVAPNGDIFVAGQHDDVDANGDADCVDAGDWDFDGDLACDTDVPQIYKSTDGGASWRRATGDLPNSTLIRQIAISPNYPSDDFIVVVFTDGDLTPAEAVDGIAHSTDGGNSFDTVYTGAAAGDADLDEVEWRAVALSPDWDFGDGAGTITIGGVITAADGGGEYGSTYRASASAYATETADDLVDDSDATWVAMLETTAAAQFDATLHLAYAPDEEPVSVGRLFVVDFGDGDAGNRTYAQATTSATWGSTADGAAEEISLAAGGDFEATIGEVAFDDDYETNGVFYAAVGDLTDADVGGVYKYTGSWTNETADEGDCIVDMASLVVTGNGGTARIVATEAAGNTVCRSTNAASSFADDEFDGGDDLLDAANVAAGIVTIAGNRSATTTLFLAAAGNLGGVFKSTNGGSGWVDGSLTNDAYVVSSVTEITADRAFAKATTLTGSVDSFWYTDNYGSSADWRRVDRTPASDGIEDAGAANGVYYIVLDDVGAEESILKSTDGGMSFRPLSEDPPFEDEDRSASSFRSATTFYVGTDEGNIYYTTDGGGSWQQLESNVDFDGRIDEFDFVTGTTTFIVTALHQNNMGLFLTKDGGATFTEVPGGTPWADGDITITVNQVGYTAAGAGTLFVDTAVDMWRMKKGENVWEELDFDLDIDSFTGTGSTASAEATDGREYFLWDNGVDQLFGSFYMLTGDPDDMDWADDDDLDNLLVSWPTPPGGASTIGTRSGAPERTLQNTTGGVIWELTLTNDFRKGPVLTSPADNGTAQTNIGDNGTPVVFRWSNLTDVDEWTLAIGLQEDMSDAIEVSSGDIENNLAVVDDGDYPLIAGNRYYWRVRTETINGAEFEGPWSETRTFSVGTPGGAGSTPTLQLPLDGSTTPNVGPIQFSFNRPSGTTQYQIRILPLNNDGPGINMIIGDPALVGAGTFTAQPPVMGQGNYVLLPGSTYTWQVRASTATGSITEADGSWGPWSDVRTFRTPRPNAGTISLDAVGTGNVTTDTTPTLSWKDSNVNNFYYEIQLSGDPAFNQNPATAISFVYHNLIHGGVSNPLNSWTVPDGAALPKGRFYWRVRQRVQATPLGADEPGVGWSGTARFVVQ